MGRKDNMKKQQFLKKISLIITAITSSILFTTSAAFAYGPERQTWTMENPADYPTFNSITDNPTIGDERNFVRVGEINADVTDLKDEVEVIPGKQYLVYIYFHNDASKTYNDAAHDHSGIATNVRMSTAFSKIITPEEKGKISATISADNTNPRTVWDEAYMTTAAKKVLLRYVSGSAKIYSDWAANGSIMPSNLFSENGTLIGLNELNGIIPGCEEYHGVVSYVLQAEELSGTVEKTVSTDGTNFVKNVEVDPGTEVTYKLTIKNTGDTELNNATIVDSLPAGIEFVPGSVEFWANESTIKEKLSDNILDGGFNFGYIGTGNTIYITYRARVKKDIDCESLEVVNVAKLTYDSEDESGDSSTDSATVNVKKTNCLPESIPETGPVEIILAVVIILGIAGGGFYFYRSRKTLNTVKNQVSGSNDDSQDHKNDEPPVTPPVEQ